MPEGQSNGTATLKNGKRTEVTQIIGQAIDGGTESCMMNYYRNIDRSHVQFDFFVESTSRIISEEKIEAMGLLGGIR